MREYMNFFYILRIHLTAYLSFFGKFQKLFHLLQKILMKNSKVWFFFYFLYYYFENERLSTFCFVCKVFAINEDLFLLYDSIIVLLLKIWSILKDINLFKCKYLSSIVLWSMDVKKAEKDFR